MADENLQISLFVVVVVVAALWLVGRLMSYASYP